MIVRIFLLVRYEVTAASCNEKTRNKSPGSFLESIVLNGVTTTTQEMLISEQCISWHVHNGASVLFFNPFTPGKYLSCFYDCYKMWASGLRHYHFRGFKRGTLRMHLTQRTSDNEHSSIAGEKRLTLSRLVNICHISIIFRGEIIFNEEWASSLRRYPFLRC